MIKEQWEKAGKVVLELNFTKTKYITNQVTDKKYIEVNTK